jgi:Glycosyl transferase family 2
VINDSFSTDGTMTIIKDYIARNEGRYPIKLIQTEPHGVANALNHATEAATGDIIHYLHSDDYYDSPDALERAAGYFLANPEIVWITGNFYVEVRGEQNIIPHSQFLKVNPAKAISMMNIIHHENTFMKREAVNTYGGFCEDKNMNVEYRMWLRLIQNHQPLVVNDQFTVFIIHSGSTSTGNIILFSKSILRAFNTLQQEKVFPFIGYYEDTELYEQYNIIVERAQKLLASIRAIDINAVPENGWKTVKELVDKNWPSQFL